MSRYVQHVTTKSTPQIEPIPNSTQVKNSAGGYSWEANDCVKLQRFIILGNESGSYYASERKMTQANAEAVIRCIKADGPRTVKTIVDISVSGRAPKNDAAIFALALATKYGDEPTRRAAYEAVNVVCRIGTHIFQFAEVSQTLHGWSRGSRRAVANWYTEKSADQLAFQLAKYRQRNGWSHKDLLRLSHPKPANATQANILRWAVGKYETCDASHVLQGFIRLQAATTAQQAIQVLRDVPGLPWEFVPTTLMGSKELWEELIPNMAMTALVRNLARLTANGALAPFSDALRTVVARLTDPIAVAKARLHPVSILGALLTHQQGHGEKGSLTWNPLSQIVDALDSAYYESFNNIVPTGKRWLLGLDVSGSMAMGTIGGMPGLTPRVAAAAMSMVTARVEANYHVMAFANNFVPLSISPRERLDDIVNKTSNLAFGGTDCAIPMRWAMQNNVPVDVFAIYTDDETYAGTPHPAQALEQYRQKMCINAKLVVVSMVANDFSIADPNDAGMLDVVGFDTNTPALMADFATH